MAEDFDYLAWEVRMPESPEAMRAWLQEPPVSNRSHEPVERAAPARAIETAAPDSPQYTATQIKEYTDKYFVTGKALDARTKTILDAVSGALDTLVDEAIKPMRKQIKDLSDANEALTKAIEHLRYRGVWKDGEEYQVGNFVTSGGSMWHCNEPLTKDKPGEGTGAWKLAVMHGRDAKAITDEKKARGYVQSSGN